MKRSLLPVGGGLGRFRGFWYNNFMPLMPRVLRLPFFLMVLLVVSSVQAQDERLFRELLLNGEKERVESKVEALYRIKARSNRHYIDLTGDNRPESLFTSKRDGEDWLQIYDHKGKEVLRELLMPHGPFSRLYRIQIRKLNDASKVMVLYFYEGVTRYLDFRGTTRIYLVSYDNNDLETLSIYKGPVIWDENRTFREHYHQRKYEVSMYDLDGDNTRELTVNYGRMNRVYKYLGKGKWHNFDDTKSLLSF